MSNKKKIDPHELASKSTQIPVHTIFRTYNMMLGHCITENGRWGCKMTGAKARVRVVRMNIFDRVTQQCVAQAPVAAVFCPACHNVPDTHGGDSIYKDELKTLAM